MLDIVQQLIMTRNQSHVYLPLCLAAAFLSTYTLLVKLFFTLIMSVHLFCFAVCYKNMKNLEICYILTALVVPAMMAAVPFATSTYGQQGQGQPWCWIQLAEPNCLSRPIRAGIIEMFGLWFGPAVASLVAISLLVVLLLCVLAYRICRRSRDVMKNKVLIQQILPLVSYPIAYCVFLALPVFHNIYDAIPGEHKGDSVLDYVDEVADGVAILTAGMALLLHIIIMLRFRLRNAKRFASGRTVSEDKSSRDAIHSRSRLLDPRSNILINDEVRSSTYASFPSDTCGTDQ